MDSDIARFYKLTRKSRFDTAMNTLRGILYGIAADFTINKQELDFLQKWIDDHNEFKFHHPFNELIPILGNCLSDGRLEKEELLDIQWICEKLTSVDFYDLVTADMQSLRGIIGGIIADGMINHLELERLMYWVENNKHLTGLWPYDEVINIVSTVLADGRIDGLEQRALNDFFSEFVGAPAREHVRRDNMGINGLCAVNPTVEISRSTFCFTGISPRLKRRDFVALVEKQQGIYSRSVTPKLDYLVVCAAGNPCWAYSCYGRKVEQAVALRKQGYRITIVHEIDFLESVRQGTC